MKKNAFTLTEILLVLVVIGIIMSFSVGVIKKRMLDRDRMTIISTLYSLQKVSDVSLQKRREEGHWSYEDSDSGVHNAANKVCKIWADMVNTKGDTNCDASGADAINFVMANGVSISNFSGDWTAPTDGIKHPYKEITFSLKNDENKYGLRIFKDEPVIVPVTSQLLTSTDVVKYRATINRKNTNGTYVNVYEIINDTKNGVSFHDAICATGGGEEFLTNDEKKVCSKNLSCDRYFDCSVQIMNVPPSVVKFRGNIN